MWEIGEPLKSAKTYILIIYQVEALMKEGHFAQWTCFSPGGVAPKAAEAVKQKEELKQAQVEVKVAVEDLKVETVFFRKEDEEVDLNHRSLNMLKHMIDGKNLNNLKG